MNPLVITWAPNIFTRTGWNNFDNLTRIGRVDGFISLHLWSKVDNMWKLRHTISKNGSDD